MKRSGSEGCQASSEDLRRENQRLNAENSRLAQALEEARQRAAEAEQKLRGAVQPTPECEDAARRIQQMDQALAQRNAELEAERARWQGVVDGIADEVWMCDAQGRMTLMNLPAVTQMGLEEFQGKTVEEVLEEVEILTPDGQSRIPERSPLLRSLRGEVVRGEEILRQRATGRLRYRQFSSAPTRDASGAITGAIAIVRDITDSRLTEAALRESEAQLRTVLDQMPSGVTIRDASSERIILFNEEARRILGEPVPTVREMVRYEGIHPDGRPYRAEEWPLARALAHGETVQGEEIELRGADGSRRTISTNAAPIRTPDGRIIAGVAVFHDTTDRKRAEEEIRKLNTELERRVQERTAELEDANRELEAFSYSVSHDLRAPLRSIDGFSGALLHGYSAKLDAQGEDYLNRVWAAAQRMGQLIDDILGLSRAGRAEMHCQPVDLSALAEDVLAGLRDADPDRQVETVIAPGVSTQGDPHLLQIVLENLLGNAWKFTAHRPVARIELGATSQGQERVFFIRDNGAGFDPAYAEKLFTPFQRLHTEDEFPGTGIGLALVQRIVRRHGGRVWAEGAVEQGATVYFTLGGR